MAIEIYCAGCGMHLRVADEHAGKQARCPKCGHVTHVSAGAVPAGPPGVGEAGTVAASSFPATAGATTGAVSGGMWHLLTPEGYRYGPVDKSELDRWVAEGRVNRLCKLRVDGEGRWRGAEEVYSALRAASTGPGSQAALGATPAGMVATPMQPSGQNPFADRGHASPYYPAPYSPTPYQRPAHLAPHRGVAVMVLGILGLVFALFGWCPVLSLIAWVLGSADMREIRAGRMDPTGLGMTQAGHIMGIIGSILGLMFVGVMIVYVAFIFVMIGVGGM